MEIADKGLDNTIQMLVAYDVDDQVDENLAKSRQIRYHHRWKPTKEHGFPTNMPHSPLGSQGVLDQWRALTPHGSTFFPAYLTKLAIETNHIEGVFLQTEGTRTETKKTVIVSGVYAIETYPFQQVDAEVEYICKMAKQGQPQQSSPQQPAAPTSNKRRKKADAGGDDCDSKHPRCTACATAGTACHQEDRHRQTLTPRGHTERIEHQVAQCEALLKRHIPGFDLEKLDEILAREGIDVAAVNHPQLTPTFQFQPAPTSFARTVPPGGQQPMPPPQPGMYYPPPPHMMPPPHGYGMMPPYPPFHPMQMQGPPGSYNPHLHPQFQHPPPPGYMGPPPGHPGGPPPPQQPSQPPAPPQVPAPVIAQPQTQILPSREPTVTNKGQDPNGNDMTNTEVTQPPSQFDTILNSFSQALAKNFGVSAAIVNGLKLSPGTGDKEDLAVGSSGLSSGRDRDIHEASMPRDSAHWVRVLIRRNSGAAPPNTLELAPPITMGSSVEVWLPKDRKMVQHVVEGYFVRLNVHRPVFVRKDFEKTLNDLYDGRTVSHDPGYICSVYLVLALGTLSELNHRAVKAEMEGSGNNLGHLGSTVAKKFMPHDWPEHDEFFERALAVKPDLRVTISSLQALILLHWYLYTERQGRTLWRLVGSLVRLSIELGLHHDPTTQMTPSAQQIEGTSAAPQRLFTEEECQLRIRLWGIVLIHDRGTSILLGRPLAISPGDSNTPHPVRPSDPRAVDFSEHFEYSMPVADIQADIINSLYSPKKRQSAEMIMHNATRIIKRMSDFRKGLPEKYNLYFTGTNDWPLDRRSKLVQEITEDEGLTLLKIGISRILLLRALFNSKELSYPQRHRALVDAIITSHNTIIVHNQLIRFPDIAFFTSPIPLHIAAMVILYGHMSKCETLPRPTALEDVWLALDMLPRFRWRWERKDFNGGHPLIAKLAERVMDVDLSSVGPVSHPALITEPHWDDEFSPIPKSQQSTPTLSAAGYSNRVPGGPVYGPQPRTMNGVNGNSTNSGGSTPPDNHLVDVPTQLFYPFYPETFNMPANTNNGNAGGQQRDYSQLLAAATAGQDGSYGCQSSQDSYMSEERDDPRHAVAQQSMHMWVGVGQRGALQSYPVPPQP
ncbi:hypothetical protein D9615_004227 [Tricholomella constricta]|uniref:Xylanolytic transcriptional activator regulatory domain-containing protein n=1 Tax=Tricholomella constricta TaxID=117010 RepID=A0A8H5HF50_9AGAR|nr:hypothetical protein D9615_004227 [Tricholomella constricta]